ncbi:Nn.00g083430.m01.CDS01 [Neocucurbitaria sp. VM-36]
MPAHSRSKTASHVDVVGQGKRLSLQFPIQPAAGSNSQSNSPRSRPQSWMGAPSPVPSPDAASTPSETNILAVLAAQERYVLELKEELNKAEADLKTLKRHYALHEASKRRNDVRKVAQLQPLNTSLANVQPDQHDEDGSNLWMQKEMERRKALLTNTKTSQRKVFSGSRHLRTLSLLSPEKSYSPSFPQPLDLQAEEPTDKRPTLPTRSSTSSDLTRQVADGVNDEQFDLGGIPNMQRDNIIRAGTQMATDFKNGLFTFIEDIRQATVGDEAVNGADGVPGSTSARSISDKSARKASGSRPSVNRSASSKKPAQRTGSIGDDFWKENGLSEPKTTSMNKKTHTIKNAQTPQKQVRPQADEDEDWDNWDTPNDGYVPKTTDTQNSSDESDEPTSPVSGPGSSRTSTRYHSKRHDSKASSLTTTSSAGHPDESATSDPKRNSIPWPDLVKLSPNNLKRTASHLMKEWEKQLTPPPESRNSSHIHGDYIGRSSSPAAFP